MGLGCASEERWRALAFWCTDDAECEAGWACHPVLRECVEPASIEAGAPVVDRVAVDVRGEGPGEVVALQVDRLEVSAADYTRCVTDGACEALEPECPALSPDRPVACVRLADARAYCAWAGARLPTERERADFAAGISDAGEVYPWGAEGASCDTCVVADPSGAGCGQDAPWVVGEKSGCATTEGLLDVWGNVSEWVECAAAAGFGCVMGGSYLSDNPRAFEAATTFEIPAASRDPGTGLRCVAD